MMIQAATCPFRLCFSSYLWSHFTPLPNPERRQCPEYICKLLPISSVDVKTARCSVSCHMQTDGPYKYRKSELALASYCQVQRDRLVQRQIAVGDSEVKLQYRDEPNKPLVRSILPSVKDIQQWEKRQPRGVNINVGLWTSDDGTFSSIQFRYSSAEKVFPSLIVSTTIPPCVARLCNPVAAACTCRGTEVSVSRIPVFFF